VRLETGADGRSLFEWKLQECSGIVWAEFLRRSVVGFCERSNEPLGSMKGGEFLFN
jgi:hypothetical protein